MGPKKTPSATEGSMAMADPRKHLVCAIDTTCTERARSLVSRLEDHVGLFKFGMEFYYTHGAAGVRAVTGERVRIFLDLKLNDIPATVAGGLRAILPLAPFMTTIHATGGPDMMRAAMEAVAPAGDARPKVLAVTVLTSMDDEDVAATGGRGDVRDQVLRLTELALDTGVDGVVCSPREIADVRRLCEPGFLIVAPGIRPGSEECDDQKRTMSPGGAMAAGASFIVVGRPITRAPDPAAAAARIVTDMGRP